MAKIDTLFMTKTAEKPYRLGPHIPIQPYKGVPPPPPPRYPSGNSSWALYVLYFLFVFFGLTEPSHPQEIPIPSVGGEGIFSGTAHFT